MPRRSKTRVDEVWALLERLADHQEWTQEARDSVKRRLYNQGGRIFARNQGHADEAGYIRALQCRLRAKEYDHG